MKTMLRPFSALATTWNAYRLFRQDKLLNEMDGDTVAKWAACIPIWKGKLDTFNVTMHRSWMRNIYRHGHLLTDDPDFWKRLQHSIQRRSEYDLEACMTHAGHFNNPMPFVHFTPYKEDRDPLLGHKQTITGEVQYMRGIFRHGTHPLLGQKLRAHGMTTESGDLGLFNLPIRGGSTLLGTRKKNTENYWRFFCGEDEFPIARIIDYYKSMLTLNPSERAYASWAHAAWQARHENLALHLGNHWDVFQSEIRPLFEDQIDWELIAACHGFLVSPNHARNAAIALYAREQQAVDSTPAQRLSMPPIRPTAPADGVALAMLNVGEPKGPWAIYSLFAQPPELEPALDAYAFDFS